MENDNYSPPSKHSLSESLLLLLHFVRVLILIFLTKQILANQILDSYTSYHRSMRYQLSEMKIIRNRVVPTSTKAHNLNGKSNSKSELKLGNCVPILDSHIFIITLL